MDNSNHNRSISAVAACCAAERIPAYQPFFGLSKSPFLTTPDPDFLFLTQYHRDAITGLISTMMQRRGISVLTGDAGTGKTTILLTILKALPDSIAHFALIIHPTVSASDFMEMLLLDFGVPNPPASKPRQLFELQQMLLRLKTNRKIVALIIDEAHKLSPELLEEIRLLANLESPDGKLLQIVLSGQDELDTLLDRQDLRQFKQRVAHRAVLCPLSPEDVPEYVSYRWMQAGGETPHPFGHDALDYLTFFSGGIPRIINTICDSALVRACADHKREVLPEHIILVAKALRWIPDERRTAASGG